MITIIHTAEIRLSSFEAITIASLIKSDVLAEVASWRMHYPGVKVRYRTEMVGDTLCYHTPPQGEGAPKGVA